jgi:hypothetical protein
MWGRPYITSTKRMRAVDPATAVARDHADPTPAAPRCRRAHTQGRADRPPSRHRLGAAAELIGAEDIHQRIGYRRMPREALVLVIEMKSARLAVHGEAVQTSQHPP